MRSLLAHGGNVATGWEYGAMLAIPTVQYADGLDGLIAYETFGDQSVDLVHIAGWAQTVEGIWDLPSAQRFYRRLASFARVVLVDKRGIGLSDPLWSRYSGGDYGPWIEEATSDIITVLDAIESKQTAILSNTYGAALAVSIAATFPDRVSSLILVDPVVRVLEADDYPWGLSPELRQQIADASRVAWGEGQGAGLTPAWRGAAMIPSLRHDGEARRWLARYERAGCPRGRMAKWWSEWEFDVRPLLPLIQAPTLVMHHEGNVLASPGAAEFVASAIPGARGSLPIPSRDLELWASQPPILTDEIEHFVTGSTGEHRSTGDRAFAVVLYSDLVASTARVADMGDQRWREVLEVHNAAAARQIEAHQGRLVKFTGDGVLAVFDGPGRAIHCAHSIVAGVQQLGDEARAGLHAGEVELLGDDIAGIGADIAARVLDHAGPGEVVVSRTIKDLVAGSGFHFTDRGLHILKGVPDEWQLFALDVRAAPST
jgi:class 3 adenylate cyclase